MSRGRYAAKAAGPGRVLEGAERDAAIARHLEWLGDLLPSHRIALEPHPHAQPWIADWVKRHMRERRNYFRQAAPVENFRNGYRAK